jgi:hypothetical protein
MSDLHQQIMNLPCKFEAAWQTPSPSDWVEGYVNGHRDTRHAAAELAAAQSSRIARLEEALREIAETDWVDAALDPQRLVEIAEQALSAMKGESC